MVKYQALCIMTVGGRLRPFNKKFVQLTNI